MFIDGDHSFSACRRDFEAFHHLLSPGSIVVFHDTGPFSMKEVNLLHELEAKLGKELLVPTADGKGIYHQPNVPRSIDWITERYPQQYNLVSLSTLQEPCCGLVIMQKVARLFMPRRDLS